MNTDFQDLLGVNMVLFGTDTAFGGARVWICGAGDSVKN